MMILKTSRSNLSSNDQLSLDLPFAATKSLTARVGPTPTFSRASGATYIGSDGLIHGVDTSTTSNTIGTGSRTFTLAATAGQDQLWRTGDAVEASNGSNFMVGTVTSYDAATQSLVCNMTSIGGSGTFTSWRIGYRGPRFDHTSAGVCRGLLIEESRTNLFVQSADFSTTWSQIQVAVSTNVTTSPSGDVTADKVVPNLSSTISRVSQTFTLTGSHSMSVFAKSSEWGWLFIGPISGGVGVWFDLSNGTVGTQSSGFVGSIVSFGNGWYKCAVSFTGATTSQPARIVPTNADNTITIGDGTSGVFLWGAQLEAGSFATSYIPTVASSVVRSADVCSISGANFTSFYNQSEGTIIASAAIDALTGNNRGIYGINNNTASHGFLTFYNASSSGIVSQSRNTASTTLSPTFTNSAGVEFTRALAYYLGGCSIATNGSAVTDTAATISTQTMLTLQIGNMLAGSFQGTCHIPSIRYYRKRLSNAKFQALTA